MDYIPEQLSRVYEWFKPKASQFAVGLLGIIMASRVLVSSPLRFVIPVDNDAYELIGPFSNTGKGVCVAVIALWTFYGIRGFNTANAEKSLQAQIKRRAKTSIILCLVAYSVILVPILLIPFYLLLPLPPLPFQEVRSYFGPKIVVDGFNFIAYLTSRTVGSAMVSVTAILLINLKMHFGVGEAQNDVSNLTMDGK